MSRLPVKSPCVGICAFDEATGWCRGCLRSLDEIAQWLAYSDAQRDRVLAELKQRQAGRPPGAIKT